MYINRIRIKGFKRFKDFDLTLNSDLNIIVGDNETGKSTVVEAVNLVMSRCYDGRFLESNIDPFLFNQENVQQYFATLRAGGNSESPKVLIEAHLSSVDSEDPALAELSGTHNEAGLDCGGVCLTIEANPEHTEDLKEYVRDEDNPCLIPTEYFQVVWRSFAGKSLATRRLRFRTKLVDTGDGRAWRGPSRHLFKLADEALSEPLRRELSLTYKRLKHSFSKEAGVAKINTYLQEKGRSATTKKLSMQIDMSARAAWESSIAPHLDDLPFDCAGKGERCKVQVCLAVTDTDESQALLLEEPENHLSHSNLNLLLDEVRGACEGRQIIVTTHSAFVLNKLGLEKLILPSRQRNSKIKTLRPDTQEYFRKLPGFDTLRLILSRKCYLVEGPSDELVLQAGYRRKYHKLPIEAGVDVIAVGGLSAKRFLEIAASLELRVVAICDNDGKPEYVKKKYADFMDPAKPNICIAYDDDSTCPTLEPQLLKANSLELLNGIFGTKHSTDFDLLRYMSANKTDCALKLFETQEAWSMPAYIDNVLHDE